MGKNKSVVPINPMPDGTCRTIKYQYQQTSFANLARGGAYAATGVIKFDNVELDGNYSERELAKLIKKGGLRGGKNIMINLFGLKKTNPIASTIMTTVESGNRYFVLEYGKV